MEMDGSKGVCVFMMLLINGFSLSFRLKELNTYEAEGFALLPVLAYVNTRYF